MFKIARMNDGKKQWEQLILGLFARTKKKNFNVSNFL